MPNAWFETVAEAQRRAKKRLPDSVYGALIAGSEKGLTLDDNVAAFDELGFAPHVAGLPAQRDLATTVMGQPISLPVIISPTGVQAVHPDGEVAVARAAAARGTAMGLSSFASKPVEEVVAANPQTFFQIYWIGSRDQMRRRGRARPGGRRGRPDPHPGLVVLARPGLGQPAHPGADDARGTGPVRARGAAPAALAARLRPDRAASRPDRARTWPGPGEPAPTFFGAYGEWMQTPPPTWDDVAWLREQWGGPFMLKGVTRVDDAKRAVDVGLTAISVSNHGGNNLDGTPATIRAAAGHRRRGRRPDRGAARRRRPPRQRRRQGARPGRARGA